MLACIKDKRPACHSKGSTCVIERRKNLRLSLFGDPLRMAVGFTDSLCVSIEPRVMNCSKLWLSAGALWTRLEPPAMPGRPSGSGMGTAAASTRRRQPIPLSTRAERCQMAYTLRAEPMGYMPAMPMGRKRQAFLGEQPPLRNQSTP